MNWRNFAARLGKVAGPAAEATIGFGATALLSLIRWLDPQWSVKIAGKLARGIGRYLPRHAIGLQSLAEAYPELSDVQREKILRGVWENLGQTAAEYAHLDRIWDSTSKAGGGEFVEYSQESLSRFMELRSQPTPALIFGAHIGNWELPAVVAAKNGLKIAVVFRRPSIRHVAEVVGRIRGLAIGRLISSHEGVPIASARALEQGMHVAALCDQHSVTGVRVVFFGKVCRVSPLIARLSNHFDAPIYGARAVRLKNGRHRIEITEPMRPVRLSSGKVDVAGTMQMITSRIEEWIREDPAQWLWLHRRWKYS